MLGRVIDIGQPMPWHAGQVADPVFAYNFSILVFHVAFQK
jgi:hypothetical protein